MPASSPPVPAPRGSVGRHALEGGAAVAAAAAMMSACGVTAALALGAQNSTALSRLVPALLSMAVGGHLTLDSGSAATGGGQTGALGGMSGGGLTLELGGQVSALPLTLTFLGTTVLAVGFFRPLRRRGRPTADLLWARFGGALATTLALFTGSALLGHGTVRLPKGLMQGMVCYNTAEAGDLDDVAAALLAQQGHGGLGDPHGAEEVRFELVAQLPFADLFDRAA